MARSGGTFRYTFKINRSTGSGSAYFSAGRIGLSGQFFVNAWAEVITISPLQSVSVTASGGVDASSDTVTVTITNNHSSATFPFLVVSAY